MSDYEIFPTNAELAERAAELISDAAREAIAARGRFTFALTGGSGPKKTYALLAKAAPAQMDWSKVFVFLGDDRFVPDSSADSNYEMCRELLLSHVAIPREQVFPIHTDTATKEEAADKYAETLSQVFGTPLSGPPPALDMILLGMGDDGHCASLFPGMPTLSITDKWVVSSPPGTLPPPVDRVTFTFPVLNAARHVLFLVDGAKKAPAVRDILEGGAAVNVHPSAGVNPPTGTLLWLLDQAAASLLSKPMNVRDHLANERTFLAWFRTAISLLGFGIVIAKLRFLEAGAGLGPGAGVRSTRLGLAFAVGGLLTLVLAAWQYHRTKHMIDSGKYSPRRRSFSHSQRLRLRWDSAA